MAVRAPGTGRWQRDPRAGWLALALVALAAFIVLVIVVAVSPAVDQLNAALSAAIRSMRSPALTPVALALTMLGGAAVTVTAMLSLMLWMALRRSWAGVVYVFMTIGVGWFIGNTVVKNLIHEARPQGVAIIALPGDYSMPSSHSLASFLWLTTLCVIVMLNLPTGRHMKRWLAIVAALLIIGVGWSRVYLGVHWVGDVVAAWLLGFAWWSFTTATYFGSVNEERRVAPRPGGGQGAAQP